MARRSTDSLQSLVNQIQFFFILALALFVIGGVSRAQLTEIRGWDKSTWYQLYIAPFIVGPIIVLLMLCLIRAGDANTKNRQTVVDSTMKVVRGLLVLWFLGLIIGFVFIGGFISNSGVFESCQNNTTISTTDKRPCVANVEGSTIACIVFFILNLIVLLFNFDEEMQLRSMRSRHSNTRQVTQRSTRTSTISNVESTTAGSRETLQVGASANTVESASKDPSAAPPRYSDLLKEPV